MSENMERLERENALLRAELDNASRKLTELTEEKQNFFDEGIYDIVNSMCRGRARDPDAGTESTATGVATGHGGDATSGTSPATVAEFAITMSREGADAGLMSDEEQAMQGLLQTKAPSHDLAAPLAIPTYEDGPFEVLTLRLRLGEAEARAAALAKENMELRRKAGGMCGENAVNGIGTSDEASQGHCESRCLLPFLEGSHCESE